MDKDVFALVVMMTNAGSAPKEMRFMASGLEFALTIAAGFGLGYLIDRHVDRYLVFAMIGAIVGFLAGLYRLVTQVKQFLKHAKGYPSLPPEPRQEDDA